MISYHCHPPPQLVSHPRVVTLRDRGIVTEFTQGGFPPLSKERSLGWGKAQVAGGSITKGLVMGWPCNLTATLANVCRLAVPQFPHLCSEKHNSLYVTGFLCRYKLRTAVTLGPFLFFFVFTFF
jgi:hypothetical protein